MNEPITTAALTTAVTAPWWLPYLSNFNLFAAAALTIASVLWILTQTATRWIELYYKRKEFKIKHDKTCNQIQSTD